MTSNRFGYLCEKSLHLHRMNDCDDLNLYYRKFLNKLSKICLKIFLPLLLLIYLLTLFLCRLLLYNTTKLTFDIRTIVYLICIFLTFFLLFLIRIHTKWKTLWFCTRSFLIFLLIIPLVLTYQTEQYHILFSTISITLIYSLLTFTLIQSIIICLSISILHISLLLNQTNEIHWTSIEFISLIFYHIIINLSGLYTYIRSIRYIRQHFHEYETSLYEKNKFSVDCKKLNTIIGHCQQAQRSTGRISKLSNGFNINNQLNSVNRKFGTVINCNLSLNEQTRQHTCDELASLFDVLYCQIEQLILKQQPQAKYIFDNEIITIILFNDNDNEQTNIDNSCRLAIELFRFIQHVNNVTQWCLTSIIGIDYNELHILSPEYIEGLAYDCSRWLREECLIINRIHVSSRIYDALKENKFYEFHSYSWLTNNTLLENTSTYFLFSINMYEPHDNELSSVNNSSMIDQLTRIQAQYHVEKHLGTITLTRSLRKRSLIELTTKHLNWFNLSFKEQYDQNLTKDFQSIHRANRPDLFIYLFILLILIGSLCQAFVLQNIKLYYFISFPSIIIGLVFLIILFLYTIHNDQSQNNKNNRIFYVYFNTLICLTFSTLFLVATQYHSIQNFKYLLNSNDIINNTTIINESSSQLNSTLNNTIISESTTPSFDRQYHDYLILSPIYSLYLCSIYRQCSWMIKTLFIISCLIVQLFLFEYIWITTNLYFPSIHRLHHYTTFTLIILHGLLLIISSYVHEWLEKIDFIWLKQINNERLTIVKQRDELIKQTSLFFPLRVIDYYLRTDSDIVLAQHYHTKYDRMALLYVHFYPLNIEHEYMLVEYLNDMEYLLKTNEKYIDIVIHRKSTIKEIIFSIDTNTDDSVKSIQQLVELLFQLEERLKQISSSTINLSACLHIGCVHEILIHLENYPKIDLWSEHISLLQLLISKTQINHCLTTSAVYHLLNDLYLFRTAGLIVSTQINNTNIYYLLGRLIGDNVFQGRNTLPLTIGHTNIGTVQKSSSTDDSHHSQSSQYHDKLNCQKEENHIQMSTTTTTTTTSSSVVLNEQQSLLKHSSSTSARKHVRISNHISTTDNPSYRHTLLQALNGTTNNNNHIQQQINPIKKISNRLVTKKDSSPSVLKDYVPRMILLSDNSCWSSREAMTPSETSGSKCLILTQQMLNGSTDDNSRCKSTPPPPLSKIASTNRHLSNERKSFTEEDFRQLLQEKSIKDMHNPARSLSTTNEETASSFSGWDDVPPSPLLSIKSNHGHIQLQEPTKSTLPPSVPPPNIDCYYPRRPCDLSFTVNMTTTEDDTSSRTDTKSTVIHSPASTVATITTPQPSTPVNAVKSAVVPFHLSASPSQPPVNIMKPAVMSSPLPAPTSSLPPPQLQQQQQQQQVLRYRPVPFNLARKLVADTSESALSDISIDHQQEPWTQNIAYQSRHPQRMRLSSSYNNLHDLAQMHDSLKYLPKQSPLPTIMHNDLLQRWLEDQLNLFRHQVKQTPPLSKRKTNRLSNNIIIKNDSTDDESDTVSENTFTALTNQSHPQSKPFLANKRSYNHVRYKPLRKNSANTSHLIRHESLKHRNRPLLYEHTSHLNKAFYNYQANHIKKLPRRTDSSSMPRSDLSDISSSRPDNLSESVISNLESEYDNIYTQPINSNTTTTMSNSQILSDDDDDETTLATTIAAATAASPHRCYF
ncbi:unnamed protein product [Adineta steineri]|uniref:Guanylate cyclase domain-containing protein n=1 Tax=Adineta steineri TaxID=433720 RepID=A0A813NT57_9BILA|nr:unnamed protein product [Adineta steineri]CAF0968789.1 unnamed protein product [Adineta steineri]